jgi:hypothetical protein
LADQVRMTERADDHDQLSGRQRKLVEWCADPVVAGDVGGIGRLATENPGWGYQRIL